MQFFDPTVVEQAGTLVRSFDALHNPEMYPSALQFPDVPVYRNELLMPTGEAHRTPEAFILDQAVSIDRKARHLLALYRPVGAALSIAVVVRGAQIYEFLDLAAQADALPQAQNFAERGITLAQVLPSPKVLEAMHFATRGKRCLPLINFIKNKPEDTQEHMAASQQTAA